MKSICFKMGVNSKGHIQTYRFCAGKWNNWNSPSNRIVTMPTSCSVLAMLFGVFRLRLELMQ